MYLLIMKKRIRKKRVPQPESKQVDMILYEVREMKKEIAELKTFMNKSKGTVGVLMFMAGIVTAIYSGWDYLFSK